MGIEDEKLESVVYGATLADAVQTEQVRGIEALEADPERYPHLAAALEANEQDSDALLENKVRGFLLGVLTLHANAADRVSG